MNGGNSDENSVSSVSSGFSFRSVFLKPITVCRRWNFSILTEQNIELIGFVYNNNSVEPSADIILTDAEHYLPQHKPLKKNHVSFKP